MREGEKCTELSCWEWNGVGGNGIYSGKKVEKNEVNKNEIDMSDVKEGTQNWNRFIFLS